MASESNNDLDLLKQKHEKYFNCFMSSCGNMTYMLENIKDIKKNCSKYYLTF